MCVCVCVCVCMHWGLHHFHRALLDEHIYTFVILQVMNTVLFIFFFTVLLIDEGNFC